jgi:hypothetical protein
LLQDRVDRKVAKRDLRSDKNQINFKMFCDEVPLAKISNIADLSYRELAAKSTFGRLCQSSRLTACPDAELDNRATWKRSGSV